MELKSLSAAIAFVSMGGASVVNAGVYNYNPNNYNVIDMRKHTTPVPSADYLRKDKNLPSHIRVISNERDEVEFDARKTIAREANKTEVVRDPAEPIDEQKLIDEALQNNEDQNTQSDEVEKPTQQPLGYRR